MKRRIAILTLFAAVGLSACGSPQGSGTQQVSQPQAGQGVIALYRPSAAIGAGLRFPMTLNGSSVGNLSNGTVISQSVAPGQYVVQTSAPSVDGTSSVTVNVAAGETVYVKRNAIIGYPTYRPQLLVVSPSQAQAEIAAM
jgi:hypothetical protein